MWLLIKMDLSRNFLGNALRTRNSLLDTGITRPRTIIDMLKFKLHTRNKR